LELHYWCTQELRRFNLQPPLWPFAKLVAEHHLDFFWIGTAQRVTQVIVGNLINRTAKGIIAPELTIDSHFDSWRTQITRFLADLTLSLVAKLAIGQVYHMRS
jgi:hypothetical protein